MRQRVEVVAAVLRKSDGTYLLAQRPPGKVYAGYWEFPGGKVEPGESLDAALRREIREELGIDVQASSHWFIRRHDYEHASVRLHFFRVDRWEGVPRGLDGQAFEFQRPGKEAVAPMLPANSPILKALRLPETCGITAAGHQPREPFLRALEEALDGGLRMVQFRDKSLASPERGRLAGELLARCHAHGAIMLVNGDATLARRIGADGLHLTSIQLMACRERPDFPWVGASAHDTAQLAKAAELGCDFALLGPVKDTASHPGAATLGWDGFARLAMQAELPVFALGGMSYGDRADAEAHGAHGLAMIRSAWQPR